MKYIFVFLCVLFSVFLAGAMQSSAKKEIFPACYHRYPDLAQKLCAFLEATGRNFIDVHEFWEDFSCWLSGRSPLSQAVSALKSRNR